MYIKIIMLLGMLFCHIVDDYYLQGWLASAKQKSWWEKNAPDKLYENDYIMALFEHAFSWTFMIMIIPTLYLCYIQYYYHNITVYNNIVYMTIFCINLIIHAIIDNAKANEKQINLIEDQLIHILQIIITWAIMCL